MTRPSNAPAVASIDVATIRHRFNFDWAMSSPIEGLDTFWWWARSIRVDPNEIIADDDEGNLWSITFTTDGVDEVTFGEPVRVRETYVPVGNGDGVAATAAVQRRGQQVLASALDRPTKTRPGAAASGSNPGPEGQEGAPMTPEEQHLRERLGLAEDATDEQVDERLSQLPPAEEETEVEPEPVTEPVAASSLSADTIAELRRAGLSVVSDDTLAELQSGAQAGVAASTELETQRVQAALDAALADGRIYRREVETWRGRLNDNFAVMSAILAEQPEKVPVRERGHGGGDTGGNSEADDFAAARERRFGRRQTQEA